MSIARAFTTRRLKQSLQTGDADAAPQRSNSTKGSIGSIRHKISAPVQLIHTTNMLSYNAPDLFPKTASSTGSSHRSDDELSDGAPTAGSTPPTSPDIESAPKRVLSPVPNHLSSYFTVPGHSTVPTTPTEAPRIPQRATSHTKKSYDNLVRQRSISRMSEQSSHSLSTKASFSFSRSSSGSTGTSVTSASSAPPNHKANMSTGTINAPSLSYMTSPQTQYQHRKDASQAHHPFGQELAQVTEIAEEYGVKEQLNEVDAEEQELLAKGLCKFSPEDYLGEIRGLAVMFFGDSRPVRAAQWI
ncbi:hypothetical protein B0T26DRAFT_745433 [Lasiosphaeria miniovina]|uniref:Uncharacterized protein n=1 Tax=Lasiosphaeria miniovina TaxID=1954250 RepID=A0AA40BFP2_9PEZI|nr:uncharacterized protein B0T26DRAFT_745433 [Lasiosphaeria miniovina]KAK0733393.1 hypothetical protein B0T26DRAFT_745433 [Lasiosphaeria miniovina]